MRDKRKEYNKRKRSGYNRWFTRTALHVNPDQDLDYYEDYDNVYNPHNSHGGTSWFQIRFKRWLNAQIGRHWDDVYSDISKIFEHRTRNWVDFKKSIRWLVRTDTHVNDDGSISINKHRWYDNLCNQLYVHPITGILCYNGGYNRHHWLEIYDDEKEINLIKISPSFEYEKIDGQWYSMEYRINDPNEIIGEVIINDRVVNVMAGSRPFFRSRPLIKKYQLGHDAIKCLRKEHFVKGLNKKYIERTRRETPVVDLL